MGRAVYGDIEVRGSRGGRFRAPHEGNVYVIVDVTVGNRSTTQQSVSTLLSMEMRDDQGRTYRPDIFIEDLKGELTTGLLPGDFVRGEVGFEVPEDEDTLLFMQFVFRVPFGAAQARWYLFVP